ncbi:MAG: flagellar hook-length control protein FliK [Burkholderiaceae bacterium]
MLPPADAIGTRPLRAVEAVTPASAVRDPRREIFDRLSQIALGKTFRAEVLSRLNDGTYLIKLDNAAMRAALPGNPQVGTSLSLKFVAAQPRPTFLMLQAAEADTASLSPAARLIDAVLHASQGQSAAGAVVGKLSMLPDASGDASKIAAALKHTLTASGVFYESHLSQWAEGSRPMAMLRQEPQAQLSAGLFQPGLPAAQAGQAGSGQLVDIVTAWDDGAIQGMPVAGNTASLPALDSAGKEVLQLMNLQLQTLEQHKIIWQGELWPGQALEWEVSEDQGQGETEADAPASWTSTVRFTLPSLGTVSATIRLAGNSMDMQLRADSEQTAALLRERSDELAGALDAAGSPLDALTVKQVQDGQ